MRWDSWEPLEGDQECKRSLVTTGSMSGSQRAEVSEPQGSQMQHSKAVVLCWQLLIKHSLFWLSVIYTDLKPDWLKQSFCKSCAIHVAAFDYKQHQKSSFPLSVFSSVLLWATLFTEIKLDFDKELLWGFLDQIPGCFQKPSLVPIKKQGSVTQRIQENVIAYCELLGSRSVC